MAANDRKRTVCVFNFTKCFHSQKTDIKMTAISTKTQDCSLFPVLWQVHFNFRDYFSREDAWLFVCNYNYLELSIGKCFIFSNLSFHRETKTPTHSYMQKQKNWPTFPSKNYFQFDIVSMVADTSKTPNVTCFNRPMKLGLTSSPYSHVLKGASSSGSRDLLGHVTQIRQQETGESLLQERARKGGDWAWLAVRMPTKIGCQSVSGGTWPDRGNRRVRVEMGNWGVGEQKTSHAMEILNFSVSDIRRIHDCTFFSPPIHPCKISRRDFFKLPQQMTGRRWFLELVWDQCLHNGYYVLYGCVCVWVRACMCEDKLMNLGRTNRWQTSGWI